MDGPLRYALVSLEQRSLRQVRDNLPETWEVVAQVSDLAVLIQGTTAPPPYAIEVGPNTADVLRRKA